MRSETCRRRLVAPAWRPWSGRPLARAGAAQPGSLPDQAALERAVRARVAQLPLRQLDSLQQAVGARTWRLVQPAVPEKDQGWDLGL